MHALLDANAAGAVRRWERRARRTDATAGLGRLPSRCASWRSGPRPSTSISLELDTDDATPLAPAAPGQFVTVRLQPPGASEPLVRSYSLSGPPEGDRYRISVKVEPRGAAGRVVRDDVEVGDRIDVAAPRGRFVLDEGAPPTRPVALVSAGVGVTPVLAMLHALGAAATTRDVWWVHGARNRDEHAFATEVDRLLASLPHAHRLVFYSAPGPADRPGVDYDEIGRVTADAIAAAGAPVACDYFLCGPIGFMDSLRSGLAALGVAPTTCTPSSSVPRARSRPVSSRSPLDDPIHRTVRRAPARTCRSSAAG